MNHYVTPMSNEHLLSLLKKDPKLYYEIVNKILSAEDSSTRELYELDLFNGWFK
jgi:hypothetical protein